MHFLDLTSKPVHLWQHPLKSHVRELHLKEHDVLEACFAQRGLLRAIPLVVAPAPSLPNRAARSFPESGKLGRIACAGAVAALVIGLVLSVLMMGTPGQEASASGLPAGTGGATWNAAPASRSSWGSYDRNRAQVSPFDARTFVISHEHGETLDHTAALRVL